jgi:hypothetical protein
MLFRIGDRSFGVGSWAALALSRIGLFVVVFVVAGYPAESDVTVYYQWTQMILDGGVLGRDVPAAYGPLFHYLAAVPLLLWDSPKSLFLLAICI